MMGRSFCKTCGCRVFWLSDDEAEVMLGSLDDAPGDIVPEYELWIGRREEWMGSLHWADQFSHDREPREPATEKTMPGVRQQPDP